MWKRRAAFVCRCATGAAVYIRRPNHLREPETEFLNRAFELDQFVDRIGAPVRSRLCLLRVESESGQGELNDKTVIYGPLVE